MGSLEGGFHLGSPGFVVTVSFPEVIPEEGMEVIEIPAQIPDFDIPAENPIR
jgi:hypothetical protein